MVASRFLVAVIVALPLVLPAGAFQTAAPLRTNLAALSASPVSLSKLALPLHAKPQRRRAVLGALRAEADAGSADLTKVAKDIGNASWLAWWAQIILCVVSAVTLLFANAVKGAAQGNIVTNGIFLAGIGLALGFVNCFWTSGYRGIAARLTSEADPAKLLGRLRRAMRVGVSIALAGMLLTLLGAEQIVGTLVAKSISASLFFPGGGATLAAQSASMQLQALDIFVVQANTNTMLAHLAALAVSLYSTTRVPAK